MSHVKREMEEREEAQYRAAAYDDRRCPYCSAVVPYDTDFGEHGECPACVGALKDD